MNKKEYKKIAKKWKGHIYQTWERVGHRIQYFSKFVGEFAGKDVLELGCNAGLYGYVISKKANSYIGIDYGKTWIKQAQRTAKCMQNKNGRFDPMKVKTLISLLRKEKFEHKFNALFASYAIYHFNDSEINGIYKYILPKCDLVIIQTRTKKKTPWQFYNRKKFWNPDNVVHWLNKAGFECSVHWPEHKKFAEIVGKRCN